MYIVLLDSHTLIVRNSVNMKWKSYGDREKRMLNGERNGAKTCVTQVLANAYFATLTAYM